MNAVSLCFHCVIEEFDSNNNKHITEDNLIKYLEDNEVIRFYALILHDKDTDKNSGELKHKHYHIVIYLTRAFSKNTIIGDIAKSLEVNRQIVSVRIGDIIQSTCYLTHNEGDGKYHYSTLDIKTNDIHNLNSILSRQVCDYFLSIDYLITLVQKCNTKTEVYAVLGLKDAKLYRSLISDIWNDRFSNKGKFIQGKEDAK